MALRVLLADESSTIKKVFQLALQDFGVEVRPVNIGVDVASVAKAFKPDIIFADILLQKKNGYDVCAELKQDAGLKSVPIVLMWSGFVDLDEDKFQASHANAQLEKPFDVAALRKLVTELVPRTQSQNLAQYLTFPKATVEAEKPRTLDGAPDPSPSGEEFQQVPIKFKGANAPAKSPPLPPIPKPQAATTEKYRLNLRPEELDPTHIPVEYALPPEKIPMGELPEEETDEFAMRETTKVKKIAPPPDDELAIEDDDDLMPGPQPPPPPKAKEKAAPVVQAGGLDAEQLEKIIRQQSAEVIESVVWKVVPELAAQIIERELNKLLKERDSNPY